IDEHDVGPEVWREPADRLRHMAGAEHRDLAPRPGERLVEERYFTAATLSDRLGQRIRDAFRRGLAPLQELGGMLDGLLLEVPASDRAEHERAAAHDHARAGFARPAALDAGDDDHRARRAASAKIAQPLDPELLILHRGSRLSCRDRIAGYPDLPFASHRSPIMSRRLRSCLPRPRGRECRPTRSPARTSHGCFPSAAEPARAKAFAR